MWRELQPSWLLKIFIDPLIDWRRLYAFIIYLTNIQIWYFEDFQFIEKQTIPC